MNLKVKVVDMNELLNYLIKMCQKLVFKKAYYNFKKGFNEVT